CFIWLTMLAESATRSWALCESRATAEELNATPASSSGSEASKVARVCIGHLHSGSSSAPSVIAAGAARCQFRPNTLSDCCRLMGPTRPRPWGTFVLIDVRKLFVMKAFPAKWLASSHLSDRSSHRL